MYLMVNQHSWMLLVSKHFPQHLSDMHKCLDFISDALNYNASRLFFLSSQNSYK